MAVEKRRIQVRGVVQGVGFRPFVYRTAVRHDISGTVCNLGNMVEITAVGEAARLEAFLADLSSESPPLSRIDELSVVSEALTAADRVGCGRFSVIGSRPGGTGNSIIPPDMAICGDCLAEMRHPDSRYFDYPFTVCTNCGPRYTIAASLPYDRNNTSMVDFPLCPDCLRAYLDPMDRRYQAQPVCCPVCGPRHLLSGPAGPEDVTASGAASLDRAASLILDGRILAMKGYGGFHLVCSAANDSAVRELRRRLGRPDQPFSLMVRDAACAERIAQIGPAERRLLTDQRRPIVVCDKIFSGLSEDPGSFSAGSRAADPARTETDTLISPAVSPLHNIGMMLPYSGTHHLLFDRLLASSEKRGLSDAGDYLVMTSANLPGLPMVTDNEEALTRLADIADFRLTDDRVIRNRADDTVIRLVNGNPLFLRRSRGYVPERVKLPFSCPKTIAAVGAELNNTVSMASDDCVYLSQYIGNTKHVATSLYHQEALQSLSRLSGIVPDIWVCDSHPGFNTTKTAERFSEHGFPDDGDGGNMPGRSTPLFRVWHHHAHICSVMGDNMLPIESEVVGIALDGVGRGADGTVWGGEIMTCAYTDFERCGHLKAQPMPGGDLATYYPARMVYGILYESVLSGALSEEDLLGIPGLDFRHGDPERRAVLAQLKSGTNVAFSSSAGRFLDAVSALLGICSRRTYEGGPAMSLESAAVIGRRLSGRLPASGMPEPLVPSLTKQSGRLVLETGRLLKDLLDRMTDQTKRSAGRLPPEMAYVLADMAQDAFAVGVSDMAVQICRQTGIRLAALSGGVFNNDHITGTIVRRLQDAGISVLTPKNMPAGDGCISHGQVICAAARLRNKK